MDGNYILDESVWRMKVFGFPCFGISQIHNSTKEDRYRSSLALSYTARVYTVKCGVLFYLCKVLREPRGGKTMAPHFLYVELNPFRSRMDRIEKDMVLSNGLLDLRLLKWQS